MNAYLLSSKCTWDCTLLPISPRVNKFVSGLFHFGLQLWIYMIECPTTQKNTQIKNTLLSKLDVGDRLYVSNLPEKLAFFEQEWFVV